MSKQFPNGFRNWSETHHEIVAMLTMVQYDEGDIYFLDGTGGAWEWTESVTDEFERCNKGREWDGEYFDELEEFFKRKLKQLEKESE